MLPASTIRSLGQKEYEKRKHAALEVEALVRELREAGQYEKINSVVKQLATELAQSAQANVRKGALQALSGTAIGLRGDVGPMLPQLLPPVLSAFSDPDARVRYSACEAMYNMAKVARASCVVHVNAIFDGLFKLSADTDVQVQNGMQLLDRLMKDVVTESDAFDMDAFMPLLGERIYVSNPFSRQFLVGWISTLESVPDLDMLSHLPVFFDGLFHMLADANKEIRQQTFSVLSDLLREIRDAEDVSYAPIVNVLVSHCLSHDRFTRLTAITWLHPLIQHAESQMLPFCAQVLDAVLASLSHPKEEIREAASRADVTLRDLIHQSHDAHFEMPTVLQALASHLSSQYVPTLLAALQWIHMLLRKAPAAVMEQAPQLWPPLFRCLCNQSEEVVRLDLEALARMVPDASRLRPFCAHLLTLLRDERAILERRGTLIVRQLCELLEPSNVFVTLAQGLTGEDDLDFASQMIQSLNLILLTSPEALELRVRLKRSVADADGADLLRTLYPAWCHNPASLLSMCLVAQAYEHSAVLVSQFASMEITLPFLLQIDKLVQLLESPIFTHVRLHLLEPEHHPHLLKTLGGILMLLPQSPAFHTLQARLASVPELGVFRLALQAREWNARPASHGQERGGAGDTGGGGAAATGGKGGSAGAPAASGASGSSTAVDFVSLLSTYREVQRAHETKLLRQALRGGAGGGGAGAERGGAVGRGGAAVFDPAA